MSFGVRKTYRKEVPVRIVACKECRIATGQRKKVLPDRAEGERARQQLSGKGSCIGRGIAPTLAKAGNALTQARIGNAQKVPDFTARMTAEREERNNSLALWQTGEKRARDIPVVCRLEQACSVLTPCPAIGGAPFRRRHVAHDALKPGAVLHAWPVAGIQRCDQRFMQQVFRFNLVRCVAMRRFQKMAIGRGGEFKPGRHLLHCAPAIHRSLPHASSQVRKLQDAVRAASKD